jgi:hypothetical protein
MKPARRFRNLAGICDLKEGLQENWMYPIEVHAVEGGERLLVNVLFQYRPLSLLCPLRPLGFVPP